MPQKSEAQKIAELKAGILKHLRLSAEYLATASRTQNPEFHKAYVNLSTGHNTIAKMAMKNMKSLLGDWKPTEDEVVVK